MASRLLPLLLALTAVPTTTWAFEPLTDETIRDAVFRWLSDKDGGSYGPISDWNTSLVTDMSGLFIEQLPFNEPIGKWDTSKVTTMQSMFEITSFNQPIGCWDTSNVKDMSFMFYDTFTFNPSVTGTSLRSLT